ncbi:protein MCM10 homolog [Daphnia carinata]|uniref:protein MCM10 homolog n=1 Tax=Daphnia carinata TaxID=120202 RepID=UPI00257BA8CF|nr:protein MCM10 homolog [Daphnia carinata]
MAENLDDICDIDALAELLDEDEFLPSSSTAVSELQQSESDVLKKKLEDMEKQMAILKDQLKQKNDVKPAAPGLKDVGLNFKPNPDSLKPVNSETSSLIHTQESDSSEDEEGNRSVNKYNEFGQFVKQRLAHEPVVDRLTGQKCSPGWKTNQGALTKLSGACAKATESPTADNGFTDAFFGIKIINPLIGSSTLMQRMEGRKQIKASQIKIHMRGGDIKDDWVTMAVVVSKSEPRTSQKGKKYAIWKLSDLKDCTKQVSFFLFGEVFNNHWKMAIGSVIGILNPNFMKESKADEISFTVDHHQKVLHIGGSKDLGWCRANRKDGNRCPSFVNKSECEFCIYHVQNEFKKTSAKRSEIQSHFSGTGLSTKDRLKQKVLGKNEVFYGGQMFTGKVVAPPASKVKDNKILDSLKMQNHALRLKEEEENLAKKSIQAQFSERLLNPTAGSRNLLKCLEKSKDSKESPSASSPTPPVKSITAKDLLLQHQQKLLEMKAIQMKTSKIALSSPQLGRGLVQNQNEIELSAEVRLPKSHPRMMSAKLKALQLVRLKGPLQPSDPNDPIQKATTPKMQAKIRKRALDTSGDEDATEISSGLVDTPRPLKRTKAELDELLQAKSAHSNLVDEFEVKQSEQYFSKLERKEQMETKMLDTFEIKTTAITCTKCNYTALSASELCRREGHSVRTIKAVKRFFQCKDCKQRTISLDRLPKRPCSHCGSSNWDRAAMAKERKGPTLPIEELLIRGEERKHVNC